MKGFLYRRAVALKEFGERRRLGVCTRLGLTIRGWIMKFPARGRGK
jgi:hypothetical protein